MRGVYNERGESLVHSLKRPVDGDQRSWMTVAAQLQYRMVSEHRMSSGRLRLVGGSYTQCIKQKQGVVGEWDGCRG